MAIDTLLTSDPIIVPAIMDRIATEEAGGTCVFIGTVRSTTKDRRVVRLEFEAYEPLALSEMNRIAEEARSRWPLIGITIYHRIGILSPGEVPVVIAVSAAHRDAAFEACRFCIDTLKQTVPIWKKEIFSDGEIWVSAHP